MPEIAVDLTVDGILYGKYFDEKSFVETVRLFSNLRNFKNSIYKRKL